MLRGEEAAFREFVDLFKDRLLANMFAHVGCRHDAEEIVQEAFFRALKHLPRFQHQSQLYTWIYRIAWNASASRARKIREEISLEASGADESSSAPESFEPHIPMERRERVASLRRAMAEIDKPHRQILILREFDELSYREIAKVMNIPLGTVRSRLARARERLRDQLVETEVAVGEAGARGTKLRAGHRNGPTEAQPPIPSRVASTHQDWRFCEI